MASLLSSRSFTLCVLLALMFAQKSTSRKVVTKDNQKAFANTDDDDSSSHMMNNHMDPSEQIFFTINDLRIRKSLPIFLSYKDPSTSPHLLPRDEANSIPFSSSQLPYLLKFFSFSKDSHQAEAMKYTLTECEFQPLKGETKFCATSLESMLDFTSGVFGLETNFKLLTTNFITNPLSGDPLQNYTILELPEEISAPKMVACHSMPYPYAVFYCHYQESENKLFKVFLSGENGVRVEAAAVCHMDTSQWNRDHASFRVLKIEPGTSPVCHFLPADNLVWVPDRLPA